MKLKSLFFVAAIVLTPPLMAADTGADREEVERLLSGAVLQGIYLRTGSTYTLEFGADGRLARPGGAEGRWWVNDEGQYCREWLTGRLKGNKACLDLVREGEGIALYSHGKRVAEGTLSR